MELLLRAERQEHLELAAESNDPEARESHRVVSRWIKAFLDQLVEEILLLDEQDRHPTPNTSDQTEYMEFDSGTSDEGSSLN